MPLPPASQPIAESDYEAIEAAVKETARGRWFLDEFAQRNRHADTRLVLDAIQRLQRSVLGAEPLPVPAPAPQIPVIRDDLRDGLHEIERTAEKTRAVLAQIDAEHRRDGDLGGELDLIVAASAQAISGVLSDADRIGEISATMRSHGIAEHICDQLDGLAGHINTACAFQDLTGQRTRKVVSALRQLEVRIGELVKLWQAESPAQMPARSELLGGTPPEGEGLIQNQIDELLSIDRNHDIFWEENAAAAASAPVKMETAPRAAAPSKNASGSTLERLTPEERLALFS